MKIFRGITVLGAVIGAVVAGFISSGCSSTTDSADPTHINGLALALANKPTAEKADDLAKAAEILLDAKGFSQASALVDAALAQDPACFRALFLKALLKPVMTEKGLYARLKPLASRSTHLQETYDAAVAQIPTNALHDFLFDGSATITSEMDLQADVDSSFEAIDELRVFLRNNKNHELTMKASSIFLPRLAARYADACEIVSSAELTYDIKCPDRKTLTEIGVNRADFEFIEDMASVIEGALAIGNAYDLTQASALADQNELASPQNRSVIFDRLFSHPAFGRLRGRARIQSFRAFMLDFAAGARWVDANAATLCSKGDGAGDANRPGMLIAQGLCLPLADSFLDQMDSPLAGQRQKLSTVANGQTLTTDSLPFAPFLHPVADLRALSPLRFNSCGQLTGTADPTLGGFFPNGEGNSVLALSASSCQ